MNRRHHGSPWRVAVLAVLCATAAGLITPSTPDAVARPPADPRPAAGAAGSAIMNHLIPRRVLFGNPERAGARISPDGRYLSYLAPVDGVLNVWVGPVDDVAAARPVTQDKQRGIRTHFWAFTSNHVLYTQDVGGDENWHVYCANVTTGTTIDLTPLEKVHATINGVSERLPDTILVGLNDRVPQLHDIYRVNIETGARTLVEKNPGFASYLADDDYQIRVAITYTPAGGQKLLKPDGKNGWSEFLQIDPVDAMTTGPVGFDKKGETLYLLDSRERNTAALMALDLASDAATRLAESPRADIDDVLLHPTEKNVQAVSFTYSRKEWQVLDQAVAGDFAVLKTVEDGEFVVTSRTLDDRVWTVAYILDDGPVRFYRYDRPARVARFLFASRRDLDEFQLTKMHPVVIKSRDELDLVSYLSLPPVSDPDQNGRPDRPLPTVLHVHGGPWARDTWGYDPVHQWLANRGYAVLSVNYRGSTGFGKEFINAANGQWAGKMHDDLVDAVEWAIEAGVADARKTAIMGGSYGGYATLVGLTFTPELFTCGVDIVGPSSLVTLLENAPPYWAPFMPVMKDRVGDHTTAAGRTGLLARSPLKFVDRIQRPLLIGQGANDPRVTRLEADQIVKALQQKRIPVTYVLFPDEGHGFARPANRLSFHAVAEAFLAAHLGGHYQPVGDDFQGSTITVPVGADGVPGLAAALDETKP